MLVVEGGTAAGPSRRHPPGDFRHRHEQGERALGRRYGLIGDADDFGGNEILSLKAGESVTVKLSSKAYNQAGADLFINTTVAPNAAPTLGTFSDRVPVGEPERDVVQLGRVHPERLGHLRRSTARWSCCLFMLERPGMFIRFWLNTTPPLPESATIIVAEDGECDCSSIQEAIDRALPGTRIMVRRACSVVALRALLRIRSSRGFV